MKVKVEIEFDVPDDFNEANISEITNYFWDLTLMSPYVDALGKALNALADDEMDNVTRDALIASLQRDAGLLKSAIIKNATLISETNEKA